MRQLAQLDYAALADDIIRDGGFTIALDGTRPPSGYAVSLAGYERIARPYGRRELESAIYAYVIDHASPLRDAGAHIGAWMDAGRLYLDVTHVIADRSLAITMGELNHQLAIFNLSTGEEIALSRSEVTK